VNSLRNQSQRCSPCGDFAQAETFLREAIEGMSSNKVLYLLKDTCSCCCELLE